MEPTCLITVSLCKVMNHFLIAVSFRSLILTKTRSLTKDGTSNVNAVNADKNININLYYIVSVVTSILMELYD